MGKDEQILRDAVKGRLVKKFDRTAKVGDVVQTFVTKWVGNEAAMLTWVR